MSLSRLLSGVRGSSVCLGVEWWAAVSGGGDRGSVWVRRSKVGGFLDGQLEGDVHLSFLSQRDDFRKLYNLRTEETNHVKLIFFFYLLFSMIEPFYYKSYTHHTCL